VDHYGTNLINTGIILGYQPPFPNAQYYAPPSKQVIPLYPITPKFGYWELLSPALFGATGALLLGLYCGSTKYILTF